MFVQGVPKNGAMFELFSTTWHHLFWDTLYDCIHHVLLWHRPDSVHCPHLTPANITISFCLVSQCLATINLTTQTYIQQCSRAVVAEVTIKIMGTTTSNRVMHWRSSHKELTLFRKTQVSVWITSNPFLCLWSLTMLCHHEKENWKI